MENLSYIRFTQRRQNFRAAVKFVRETIEADAPERIKEVAIIKAYEMAFELFWKTLKDYLEYAGFSPTSPREVIKESFAQGYLREGALFLTMLEERNLLNHVYNSEQSASSAITIQNVYQPELAIVLEFLELK